MIIDKEYIIFITTKFNVQTNQSITHRIKVIKTRF